MNEADRDQLIKTFHTLGMNHKDILITIAQYGCVISERHLRRVLRRLHLYRRKFYSDIGDVVLFIQHELEASGQLHGYRWLVRKCEMNGMRVRTEDIRLILGCLDAEGAAFRRARKLHRRKYYAAGPHYSWHLDGYDKIKRFGFAISGCIDGFSRNIIWLKVYSTNNDPKLIAGYFVEALKENNNGCPRIMRGDCGTENVRVKRIQETLMGNGRNGHHVAYIEGSSTSNQRIESFWSILRKECMEYWICFFNELQDNGLFTGDIVDTSISQFCFLGFIQKELDDTAAVWNQHIIRSCRRDLPSGRPQIMMHVPSLYGTHSYSTYVTDREIEACKNYCRFRTAVPCDSDIYDLCCYILHEEGLQYPMQITEGIHMYYLMRQIIRNLLNI